MIIYVTLMPVILAGIFNMVFCKMSIFETIKKPIDNYKTFVDGKRIFGDNKTYKGFLGMIFLGIISSVLWGFLCSNNYYLQSYNLFYKNYDNTITYNILIGFLLGLIYVVFELPNSFIKRRLNIVEGKTATGLLGFLFIFIDQADSLFGCVAVINIFYKLTFVQYILFVFVGACTHIVINITLYFLKIRRNMF